MWQMFYFIKNDNIFLLIYLKTVIEVKITMHCFSQASWSLVLYKYRDTYHNSSLAHCDIWWYKISADTHPYLILYTFWQWNRVIQYCPKIQYWHDSNNVKIWGLFVLLPSCKNAFIAKAMLTLITMCTFVYSNCSL